MGRLKVGFLTLKVSEIVLQTRPLDQVNTETLVEIWPFMIAEILP